MASGRLMSGRSSFLFCLYLNGSADLHAGRNFTKLHDTASAKQRSPESQIGRTSGCRILAAKRSRGQGKLTRKECIQNEAIVNADGLEQ